MVNGGLQACTGVCERKWHQLQSPLGDSTACCASNIQDEFDKWPGPGVPQLSHLHTKEEDNVTGRADQCLWRNSCVYDKHIGKHMKTKLHLSLLSPASAVWHGTDTCPLWFGGFKAENVSVSQWRCSSVLLLRLVPLFTGWRIIYLMEELQDSCVDNITTTICLCVRSRRSLVQIHKLKLSCVYYRDDTRIFFLGWIYFIHANKTKKIILELLMLISKALWEDQRQKSKEMKGNLAGR